MDPDIKRVYGNRVRARVSGLCWEGGKLLMVNHQGLSRGDFWAPPGGGLEFGMGVRECLEKEFLEETGLLIRAGSFLFACEFIQQPLHAIELFFEVRVAGGALEKGDDPELPIIRDVRFMSAADIAGLPASSLHGIFGRVSSPEDLKTLTGFFTI